MKRIDAIAERLERAADAIARPSVSAGVYFAANESLNDIPWLLTRVRELEAAVKLLQDEGNTTAQDYGWPKANEAARAALAAAEEE